PAGRPSGQSREHPATGGLLTRRVAFPRALTKPSGRTRTPRHHTRNHVRWWQLLAPRVCIAHSPAVGFRTVESGRPETCAASARARAAAPPAGRRTRGGHRQDRERGWGVNSPRLLTGSGRFTTSSGLRELRFGTGWRPLSATKCG